MKFGRRQFIALIISLGLVLGVVLFRGKRKLPDLEIPGVENNPGTRALGAMLREEGSFNGKVLNRKIRQLQGLSAEAIRERIRQDFQDAKLAIVKGWILSETEALACVYYAERAG